MEQFISEGLSKVLEFEVPDDLIKYIMGIDKEPDFNDYMKTLLDFDNPQHRSFFMELVKKKFPPRGGAVPKQKKKISKSKQSQPDFVSVEVAEKPAEKPEHEEKEGKVKKKAKFVNLYSKEGQNAQVVMLKGRHRCECEASKHELINNCLNCGRIVCTQEGSGPCLFCGNLVCTPEEEKAINSNTKSGSKLLEQLKERERPEGWQEALAHMHKLLDFQKNSEKRTQVVDDDCDYFNTNSVWLSQTEKEKLEEYQTELQQKKHESRRNKKMTFDFAGRQIVEEKRTGVEGAVDLERIKQITSGETGGGSANSVFVNDMMSDTSDPSRDVAPGVNAGLWQFDPNVPSSGYASAAKGLGLSNMLPRVQDAELQEMTDTGKCLSMHQPWASLLVEGIKLHEGRTWYTSHRGRLWIASTAKPPDDDIIRTLENQYRVLYPEKNFKFPSFYPTGCLMGCVNVDDCLTQEEYQKRYPGGESDSPYVFICSNPVSLRLRFPIKGQHKIYQLEKTIHKAAVKCIQTMSKMHTEEVTAG
ncbi:hypothetical protein O0L34_g7610 [Tuta absoluta]|nr:hypothetical protein O0L34_g7610 [Tuta absoluta]